mmetsp:Transcript_19897/g.52114  ORF Transcript_19897/g.52114 Transcript_19897/m.52114 type:complete len:308 (-) Transcript_19897:873-1796(-)
MYSLGVREKQLARERSLTAIERRHNTGKRNHARANRLTEGAFGKTRDMMADDARNRRQEWLMNTLSEPDLNPATQEGDEVSFHEHTFRDRHPELEIGNANGHVSARKYVPRVHYRGGGMLDRSKTLSLQEGSKSDQTVNLLDPRASTCSLYDTHTIRGRIVQAPYDGGIKYLLREREPAKELHPPLHFRAKNDLERVNESLAQNTINDDGEWEEPPVLPSWRVEKPQKWLGGRFKNCIPPARNDMAFMDHHKYPVSSSVRWSASPLVLRLFVRSSPAPRPPPHSPPHPPTVLSPLPALDSRVRKLCG